MIPEFETPEIKAYLDRYKGIELMLDDLPYTYSIRLTIKSKHCNLSRSISVHREVLHNRTDDYWFAVVRELIDEFKNDLVTTAPKATGYRYMDPVSVNRHGLYDEYDFDYDQGYQEVKQRIIPKKEEKIENENTGIF